MSDQYRSHVFHPARAAFEDGMAELTELLAEVTNKACVLGVRVSEELGLAIGILPGEAAHIMTITGLVKVESEPNHRRADLTVEALRLALGNAVAEIDEHNSEYEHRTPESKLEMWRKLAVGDPLTETFARLDAAGMRMKSVLGSTPGENMIRRMYAAADRPNRLHQLIRSTDDIRHVGVELPRWEDDGGAAAEDPDAFCRL